MKSVLLHPRVISLYFIETYLILYNFQLISINILHTRDYGTKVHIRTVAHIFAVRAPKYHCGNISVSLFL